MRFDSQFAEDFLRERIDYLEKDIRICLRSYRSNLTDRMTQGQAHHAYWPAFMTCLSCIELMTKLFLGKTSSMGEQQVLRYTNCFMADRYKQNDGMDLLWRVFRNSIAHGGRPPHVYVERKSQNANSAPRRIAWHIDERPENKMEEKGTKRRHLELLARNGTITNLPRPWEVPYTHVYYVSLRTLKAGVQESIDKYCTWLLKDAQAQKNFMTVVQQLFPRCV